MRTRRLAVLPLVVLISAGCANNGAGATPERQVASGSVSGAAAPGGSPEFTRVPSAGPGSSSRPVAVPSLPVRSAAAETISGTVLAGAEPHCLVLQDAKGSYVLIFPNASMKASVAAGAKVTVVGHAEPTMMTTCQEGVAFVVTSVGDKN